VPTPLPGANLIAFETYRDGNGEIYLLDTHGDQLTNLTRHLADDRAPAWRPDGGAIAFESHRDGNWEVYVLDLADGSLVRLTEDAAYDGAPSWSPNGTEIAFESYRDGNLEIYTVPATGGQPRRLTDHPAGDYGPAWNPQEDSIAFASWRDGNKEIYTIPASGGEPQNQTQDPADDESPAWTPDGMALAFVSWRDVDEATGNRNAEIYLLSLPEGTVQRLTENLWPDLDPAWDTEERLVWTAYEPGPPFETYDPYQPGDYHIYRSGAEGPERMTSSAWDDRHPGPAPPQVDSLAHLAQELQPQPPSPTPMTTLESGTLARVIAVPSILASFSEQPIQVNELVAPSLVSWQHDLLQTSGWDFLNGTLGSWRNIDQVRKREMYAYDYGFLSWHKTGRALDLALEYKVDGANQMILTREDLGQQVYWRMYLRTAKQDGTQGEPMKDNPWLHWWHIVPEHDPVAYDAGGKRQPIPGGYYADVTAIAKRHGWERIACYAIEGDYHWNTDSNATEYWHYERTDGMVWWDAMQQIYAAEELEEHVGWQVSLNKAQTKEMMLSKGIPTALP
jgi:TolB protein